MKKEFGQAKKFRMEVGYILLQKLEFHEELPISNKNRLAKTMQEYFEKDGIIDDIREQGYKWNPDVDYWHNNISDISLYMKEHYKIYFDFLRTEGFKGIWKFMSKGEYEKHLKWNSNDISTRTDNHNDKIDLGEKRWQIEVPKIAKVPKLT